jgi:hypothetical protein
MPSWIEKQWIDIKGNVKYALLVVLLGGGVTGATLLVRGLPLWKDAVLIFIFTVFAFWGAIATWLATKGHKGNAAESFAAEQGAVLSPLQIEVLQLAKDLQAFIDFVGPAPAEKPHALTSKGFINGMRDSMHRFGTWSQHLKSGYATKFSKKVKYLRHELATRGVTPWPVISDDVHAINYRDVLNLPPIIAHSAVELDYPQPPTNPSAPLFAPLQTEAFQLAKELCAFKTEIGPRPRINLADFDNSSDPTYERIKAQTTLQEPWVNKLTGGYAVRFKQKVELLKDRFLERNLDDKYLDLHSGGIATEENLTQVSDALISLAMELGKREWEGKP